MAIGSIHYTASIITFASHVSRSVLGQKRLSVKPPSPIFAACGGGGDVLPRLKKKGGVVSARVGGRFARELIMIHAKVIIEIETYYNIERSSYLSWGLNCPTKTGVKVVMGELSGHRFDRLPT